MSEFRVTDKTGREINRGDIVTDFRGEEWIFEYVSRGTEYNGTAKVVVNFSAVEKHFGSREFYDRVFGLKVERIG